LYGPMAIKLRKTMRTNAFPMVYTQDSLLPPPSKMANFNA